MLVSLSVVATAGAAVVAAWQIRAWPGAGWPVAVALLVAQIWAAVAFALTVGAMRAGRRQERHTANGSRSVATIVCFRGQTRDLLVTSIARASALGEVVVLDVRPDDPDPELPDDLPGPADPEELCDALGLALVVERQEIDGLAAAFQLVHADAVLVVEAATAVDPDAVSDAARQLDGPTAWVAGRTTVYNDDAFSPEPSQDTDQTVRRGARRLGVPLWEEDATLLRTADVRDVGGLGSRRPLSATLRRLERSGRCGHSLSVPLALVTVPTEAGDFWAVRCAEQRREAQESVSTLGGGRIRSRLTALGVLLRSLRGVPALGWLAAPVAVAVTGVSPIDGSIAVYVSALVGLGIARAALASVATGDTVNPGRRLLVSVYELPGSLAAASVLFGRGRRRERPVRSPIAPSHCLTWVAILATGALWLGLAEVLGVTDFRGGAHRWWGIAGCGVILLVLAAAGLRVDALLRSGRSSFRFRLRLAAVIGDQELETVDVSASGLRVRGLSVAPPAGSSVHGSLRTTDGMHHAFDGHVTRVADVDGDIDCGIELDLTAAGLVDWSNWLFEEVSQDASRVRSEGGYVAVPGSR